VPKLVMPATALVPNNAIDFPRGLALAIEIALSHSRPRWVIDYKASLPQKQQPKPPGGVCLMA
jgi:hypothetical protein